MSPPELAADGPVAFFGEPIKVAFGVTFGDHLTWPLMTASIASWERPGLRKAFKAPSPQASPGGRGRSSLIFMNHWSTRRGSIGFLLRSEWARSISRSSISPTRPAASRSATTASRALATVEAAVFFRRGVVERAVVVEQIDHADFGMALPDFVVIGVVARRDLYAAGAEFGFGPFVGDEGNFATGEGQFEHGAAAGHVAELDEAGIRRLPAAAKRLDFAIRFRLFLSPSAE